MSMNPDNVVDISTVLTWPQAIVAIFIILAFAIWPGVLAWLTSRSTHSTVNEVKTTLQDTNGGSSVRDALNRIESRQEAQGRAIEHNTTALVALHDRVGAVEEAASTAADSATATASTVQAIGQAVIPPGRP